MQLFEEQFLFLLKTYCNKEKLPDGYRFDVGRVFSLAAIHNLVPQIYTAATGSEENVVGIKPVVISSCGCQIMKNSAFEALFDLILKNGIDGIVVKGPVCADCYPDSDMRLSSDFDIVVSSADKEKLHAYLLKNGFDEKNSIYTSKESGLYIEVSTQLGEGNEWLENAGNEVFDGFFDRAVFCGKFRTLEVTEHLVYLLYHAFKHFVGSGFGLKQIADIYMYIKKYSAELDPNALYDSLKRLDILNFSYNVFFAIEKIFDYDMSAFLAGADERYLQYNDFVSDLLSAGVFGKSSEDRLHSATVVMNTVEAGGKKSLFKTVFPSFALMCSKYGVLKYLPFLLPVFWLYRLAGYIVKSVFGKKQVSPKKSIEIANSRIELMKNMGII